ncbi:hypothetical protein BOTBODRAFT_31264 [Botryobasidium botryosum FD-172 SS1]|uniref:Uncharacterized protein n=1 Tax=Botryobasidium botryosum (strain FD-172 SS1) TaxID=930990 RepID=A0A067MV96_BOTB1|nr:hypothetical protein BOTBODRAFT_31264 [Botryobasidium botryosum FD-172 SS1]
MEAILADTIPPLLQTLVERIRQSFDVDAEKGSLFEEIKLLELASGVFNTYTARALSSLRYRQNQLIPVHRLPDDVLSMIFMRVVESVRGDEYFSSNYCPVRISGVCQRWRAVALGTSQLWAYVDATGPRPLMDIFSSHSGGATLHISARLDGTPSHDDYQAGYWSRHASRWGSLKLTGYRTPTPERRIREWIDQDMPSLEVLDISVEDYGLSGVFLRDISKRDTSPRLRCIALRGILLTDSTFANLINLRLGRIIGCEEVYVVHLLQAIGASPLLEGLYVGDIHPLNEPDLDQLGEAAPRNIDLSHLQFLSLVYLDMWMIQFILSRVTIPPRAKLEIKINGFPHDKNLSHILPPSPVNLRNLQSIDTLMFSWTCSGDFCVVQGDVTTNTDGGCLSSLLSIHFCAPLIGGPVLAVQIAPSLEAVLSFMPVRLLSLEHFPNLEWAICALVRALDHSPSINTLFLRDCHENVVQALSATPSDHPCPGLRVLGILECRVSDDTLISMVRSRTRDSNHIRSPGVALEQLCLSGPPDESTAVRDALSPLLEISSYSGAPFAEYVPNMVSPPTDGSERLR